MGSVSLGRGFALVVRTIATARAAGASEPPNVWGRAPTRLAIHLFERGDPLTEGERGDPPAEELCR